MMFLGQFEHQLDDKGRLTLPAKYRAALAAGVVVTRALKRPCLLCYPMSEWESFASQDAAASGLNVEASTDKRQLYAFAEDLEVDKQGRILLSERLRRYANIGNRVVVAGVNRCVELWEPDAWEAEVAAQNAGHGA